MKDGKRGKGDAGRAMTTTTVLHFFCSCCRSLLAVAVAVAVAVAAASAADAPAAACNASSTRHSFAEKIRLRQPSELERRVEAEKNPLAVYQKFLQKWFSESFFEALEEIVRLGKKLRDDSLVCDPNSCSRSLIR